MINLWAIIGIYWAIWWLFISDAGYLTLLGALLGYNLMLYFVIPISAILPLVSLVRNYRKLKTVSKQLEEHKLEVKK